MDERLKDVHRPDMTESKVNEEFVDWLKTKGPNWLLAILLAICVYFVVLNLQQRKATKENAAWAELTQASQSGLPGSLEDVAEKYPKIDQVANVARLQAAQQLMLAVQSGLMVGAEVQVGQPVNMEAEGLSEEERERYLDRAEALYEAILESDAGSRGETIHVVGALNGLGAVAESRGDGEQAAEWYRRAAERAGDFYPRLQEQALARAESVEEVLSGPSLMKQVEITAAQSGQPVEQRTPVELDEALRDLLIPEDAELTNRNAPQQPIRIR
jgi:tetratricopeptide (TPR) repeat protein